MQKTTEDLCEAAQKIADAGARGDVEMGAAKVYALLAIFDALNRIADRLEAEGVNDSTDHIVYHAPVRP